MKPSAPLFLSSNVNIAAGATAVASTFDLTSPFREPIWIDAITWSVTGSNGVILTAANWGATLRTRLSLGRTELTRNRNNGFVPIWNLSSQVNQGLNVRAASNQVDENTFQGVTNFSMSFHKWKLPRPLYVPPGMSLQSEFFRSLDGIPGSLFVSVGYAGRYVDPGMTTLKKASMPFATFFEIQPGGSSFLSDAQDMVNPFEVPLCVQRFIGRAIQSTGNPVTTLLEVPLTSQIKIQDSHGHNIVRDFIPNDGSVVLDYNRRGWTFNKILSPKQWYNFQVIPAAGPSSTFDFAQQFSMIGHREEEYA
jgi:hypothetical protein